jgi:hypothetical protein
MQIISLITSQQLKSIPMMQKNSKATWNLKVLARKEKIINCKLGDLPNCHQFVVQKASFLNQIIVFFI